jgi:hypothetical protein
MKAGKLLLAIAGLFLLAAPAAHGQMGNPEEGHSTMRPRGEYHHPAVVVHRRHHPHPLMSRHHHHPYHPQH